MLLMVDLAVCMFSSPLMLQQLLPALTGGPTTYVSAEMSSCVARAAPSLSNDDILPRWRA